MKKLHELNKNEAYEFVEQIYGYFLTDAFTTPSLADLIDQCMSEENRSEAFKLTWMTTMMWVLKDAKHFSLNMEELSKNLEKN